MKRRRRWALLVTTPLLAFALSGLCACDALRAADPPNSAADVPSSFGPCGSWVDCGADQPKEDRCCYPTTKCWIDADGSKSCVGDSSYDPSDPVTWGAKKMAKVRHFKRVSHGQ